MFSQKYKNEHITNTRRTLWHFLLWKTGRYKDFIPRPSIPGDFCFPNDTAPFDKNLPSCTWMGHCTFLIEIGGISILTDPIWDTYCSPIPFKALKRTHEPPMALSDLPPVDFILISHNHYDHLDAKTVRHIHSFHPQVEWIVPLGLSSWFRKRGILSVRELNRWENCTVKNCKITAVPAQHFSGRGLFDRDKTFWNGYVVEWGGIYPNNLKNRFLSASVLPQNSCLHSRLAFRQWPFAPDKNFEEPPCQNPDSSSCLGIDGKRFYFTGDTGYNAVDFKEIGSQWPYMDLSLIPIGTYIPQKFMQPVHCSPWEAVEIHREVRSNLSIGMHWKTFRLSDEPLFMPPYDLFLSMQERKVPLGTFLALDPGVSVNW